MLRHVSLFCCLRAGDMRCFFMIGQHASALLVAAIPEAPAKCLTGEA